VRPSFWLFQGDRGFVARACHLELQVIGETPSQAIHGLREAFRQHRRVYGRAVEGVETPAEPAFVVPQRAGGDAETRYQAQIAAARISAGFWHCHGALRVAVNELLSASSTPS